MGFEMYCVWSGHGSLGWLCHYEFMELAGARFICRSGDNVLASHWPADPFKDLFLELRRTSSWRISSGRSLEALLETKNEQHVARRTGRIEAKNERKMVPLG